MKDTEVSDALVKAFPEELEDCFAHPLMNLQDGNFRRTTNKKADRIKLNIGMNADEVVKDHIKGIPMRFKDWKLYPVIVFMKFKDKEEKKEGE